jgi:O-antigen/teichoic acid export membrane protein
MRQRLRDWLKGWERDLSQVRKPGSFARNALYTSGDAVINILSQIILTPILARLYPPAAYGVYGLFSSITNNLSTFAGLGYPIAFLLPKENDRFHALVRFTWLLLLVCTLLTLPVFLFPSVLYRFVPSWSDMGAWSIAVPWMVLVIGLIQILTAWAARVKEFGRFARTNSITNVGIRLGSMGLGFLKHGSIPGLIVSEVVVRTLSLGFFFKDLWKHGLPMMFKPVPRQQLTAAALEYKEYPLYIFPGRWLNVFTLQLPIYALMWLDLKDDTGRFTMAGALLLMPLRLFGYSLYGVFLRRAIEAGTERLQEMADLTLRMHNRLFALGVAPFMLITFFADVVFHFVLGPEWRAAGVFTSFLGPFYLFRLLSEPLSAVYIATRSERSLFLFHLLLFVANAVAVFLASRYLATSAAVVGIFAAVNALAYFLLSARILRQVGLHAVPIMLRTLAITAAVGAVFALLRYVLLGSFLPVSV